MVSPILLALSSEEKLFTATVVIAGISIVLGVLILLILIFYLFGFIVSKSVEQSQKRAAKRAEKKAKKNDNQPSSNTAPAVSYASKQAYTPPAPVVEQGISGEVVAAITAAIVATEGQNVVVRSIKKKNVGSRNPWASAATYDNTRPF